MTAPQGIAPHATALQGTGLRVASLAERPDLAPAMIAMETSWPAFVTPSPILVDWAFDRHPHHQLVVVDDQDAVVARAASVPLAWNGVAADLPDTGWDEALRQSMTDTYAGRRFTALCALEIAIVAGLRTQHLSSRTLQALADHGRACGFDDIVGPVRPTLKHERPQLSMQEYVALVRADGLPQDPWLRVHVRAGGQVLQVCPASMTISGSLARWREWTGLPFDVDGPVEVPGALVPVTVSTAHDHAVYVEPNVWVRHRLTGSTSDHEENDQR